MQNHSTTLSTVGQARDNGYQCHFRGFNGTRADPEESQPRWSQSSSYRDGCRWLSRERPECRTRDAGRRHRAGLCLACRVQDRRSRKLAALGKAPTRWNACVVPAVGTKSARRSRLYRTFRLVTLSTDRAPRHSLAVRVASAQIIDGIDRSTGITGDSGRSRGTLVGPRRRRCWNFSGGL